jgi:hypothetical protein
MRLLVLGGGPAAPRPRSRRGNWAPMSRCSAETVQVVAAAMSAGLNVEQLAEIQFAFPTFTEAVSMAAQMACHTIGIGRFPPSWSYLGSPE